MSEAFGVECVAKSEVACENASNFTFDETMHRLSLVTSNSLDVIVHIKNSGRSLRDAQRLPQLESSFKTDPWAQVDSSRGDSSSAPMNGPKWNTSVGGSRATDLLTAATKLPTCPDRCLDHRQCQASLSQETTAHRIMLRHERASKAQKNKDALATQLAGSMLSRQAEGQRLFASHDKIAGDHCLTERNQSELEMTTPDSVQNVPDRALDPTPSKWEVHYNMAIQALQSKRFGCAVTHFRDSLQIMRSTEIDSLSMADAHKGLGLAYASDGKDGKARIHFQECLEIEERKPNSDVRLVETTELLGEVCYRTGDYGEAKRNFQRAFDLSQSIWGREHAKSIHMLGSIAKTYYSAGSYNDALVAYESVLQTTQQLFGNEAVQTADAMNNIALVYRVLSEYNPALTLLKSAFKVYSSSLGLGQMRLADVANNIGIIYLEQNMLSEAEDYFQQAVRINERSFGNGHMKTEALENLGITYQRLGHVRKALSCFARVLLISKEFPAGRAHNVRTANLYKNIGLVSQSLGQHRLASRYFEKREKILANRRKLSRVGKASSSDRGRERPNERHL